MFYLALPTSVERIRKALMEADKSNASSGSKRL